LEGTVKNQIPKRVIDHEPMPFDRLRGNWACWNVTVEFESGRIAKGSMQGDGDDMWALESFEADSDQP
jgi:hypothetical protein